VDDVAEAGEAVLPVEGCEVMLVVGPVVLCSCVVLGCVEVAGSDEVNKGELPGVELLLGVDSMLLGVDSMLLLGAPELSIVEGSTSEPSAQLVTRISCDDSPETDAEEGEVAPGELLKSD